MKKVVAVILVISICLSFAGCKSSAVKNTESLIAEIGTVSLENADKIIAAIDSYKALSQDDKDKVENFAALEDAQKALDLLQKIAAVEDAIDAIGTVTSESEALINAANEAYNALSEDEKSMVSNATALADAMVAFMTACSSWEIDYYTDDFGDKTDEGYLVGKFTGNFSNTAATNADLLAVVYVMPSTLDNSYMIAFRMAEYGSSIATYSKSDLVNLSFKVGSETYNIELMSSAPKGDLYLTDHYHYEDDSLASYNKTDRKTAYNAFLNALKENPGDISCLITIGNLNDIMGLSTGGSTYRFKINGIGFAEKIAELENKA